MFIRKEKASVVYKVELLNHSYPKDKENLFPSGYHTYNIIGKLNISPYLVTKVKIWLNIAHLSLKNRGENKYAEFYN